jgi:hypothetical protein
MYVEGEGAERSVPKDSAFRSWKNPAVQNRSGRKCGRSPSWKELTAVFGENFSKAMQNALLDTAGQTPVKKQNDVTFDSHDGHGHVYAHEV